MYILNFFKVDKGTMYRRNALTGKFNLKPKPSMKYDNAPEYPYHISFKASHRGHKKASYLYQALATSVNDLEHSLKLYKNISALNINGITHVSNNHTRIIHQLESKMFIKESDNIHHLINPVTNLAFVQESRVVHGMDGTKFKHLIVFQGNWVHEEFLESGFNRPSILSGGTIPKRLFQLYGHDHLGTLWNKEVKGNYNCIDTIYYNGRPVTVKELQLLLTILKED
jgi:hypothetical protein